MLDQSYLSPIWIYLMHVVDTSFYKVGVSHNVKTRLATIQNANPLTIELVRSLQHSDAVTVEGAIMAELCDRRVRGEWFDCPHDVICEVFDRHTSSLGSPPAPADPAPPKATRASPKRGHWMQQLPENARIVTPSMIERVRDMAENYGEYQSEIARQLGISRTTVHFILKRKRQFANK